MHIAHSLKITQNVAFEFWHFPPIFFLLKVTCLVSLFERKLQVFKNSPKCTIFGIFNWLLSTQNVNVARFARNVEWDFFCDFQTPWLALGGKATLWRWGNEYMIWYLRCRFYREVFLHWLCRLCRLKMSKVINIVLILTLLLLVSKGHGALFFYHRPRHPTNLDKNNNLQV